MKTKRKKQAHASQNRPTANRARPVCRSHRLFLLVEEQPGPRRQERWAFLCEVSGAQIGTYFPNSKTLLLIGRPGEEPRKCGWCDAVMLTAERRDFLISRKEHMATATKGISA